MTNDQDVPYGKCFNIGVKTQITHGFLGCEKTFL